MSDKDGGPAFPSAISDDSLHVGGGMKLKTIAIDETTFLREDLIPICGRYFSLYLFDADEHTYCCELTPSHWLECIGFVTENQIDDDLWGDLNIDIHDISHYRHARGSWLYAAKDLDGDFETFDDAVEWCVCNQGHVEGLALAGELS